MDSGGRMGDHKTEWPACVAPSGAQAHTKGLAEKDEKAIDVGKEAHEHRVPQ